MGSSPSVNRNTVMKGDESTILSMLVSISFMRADFSYCRSLKNCSVCRVIFGEVCSDHVCSGASPVCNVSLKVHIPIVSPVWINPCMPDLSKSSVSARTPLVRWRMEEVVSKMNSQRLEDWPNVRAGNKVQAAATRIKSGHQTVLLDFTFIIFQFFKCAAGTGFVPADCDV